MNMLDVQDKLKGLSEQQLVQEMQMPSGSAPQFLVLSEITRRKRMRDSMQQQPDNSTVAQEAVAAAGVPQGGIADMARALAPKTDMTQNTGAMPVQGMYGGGYVQKMQPGGLVALQRNPAALAFAQKEAQRLGMSLEQYVSRMSLPPQSRGAMDSSSLDRFLQTQAERNRMLGFEPAGDGAEFPTQSDLDRRFQQQQQAEQFSFGASSPMTSPGPLDANVGMPRQAGRVIGAPSVASVAPQMPSIGDVFDARVESPLSPLPASGPYSMVPSALMTAENERVRLERGIPGGEGFDERAYTAPGPAPLPSTGPYSRVQSALELAQGNYDRTASGIPGGEGFDERSYMAPAPRSEERPTYPGWGANTEMQPYETLRNIQDFFSGREGVSPVEPDAGESMSGLTQEDIERLKTPAQPEPADVVTVPDRDRQASPSVPQPGGAKTTPTANDLIADTTTGGTRTSGGAGSASGATSYEQELINAMQRAERRAEQDKWLALAQVGLGLMSSTQPTIGGALGEAGLAGLQSYQGARDEYETERLGLSKELAGIEAARAAQQAAAAKARSGPTLQQTLNSINEELSNLTIESEDLANMGQKTLTAAYPQDQARVNQLVDTRGRIIDQLYAPSMTQ